MKQIFINLPVKDVTASMAFYEQLGFTAYPLFTFDDQKCMAWGEHVYLMLQSYKMFTAGNKKSLADATKTVIATFTLPVESIERLHEIVENGIRAGGKAVLPMVDEGFMQVRNIEDLDGHNWSFIVLDMAKFKAMKGK